MKVPPVPLEAVHQVAPAHVEAQPSSPTPADAGAPPVEFLSPVVRVDPETQRVFTEWRNGATGALVQQIPTPRELKAYEAHAQIDAHAAT